MKGIDWLFGIGESLYKRIRLILAEDIRLACCTHVEKDGMCSYLAPGWTVNEQILYEVGFSGVTAQRKDSGLVCTSTNFPTQVSVVRQRDYPEWIDP